MYSKCKYNNLSEITHKDLPVIFNYSKINNKINLQLMSYKKCESMLLTNDKYIKLINKNFKYSKKLDSSLTTSTLCMMLYDYLYHYLTTIEDNVGSLKFIKFVKYKSYYNPVFNAL